MPNQVLQIDRSSPVATDILTTSDSYFELIEQDKNSNLTSIDISKIEIQTILEIRSEKGKNINQSIESNLKKLQDQGFILLDLQVLQALFKNPSMIPSSWTKFADADSIEGSPIRFNGTQLRPGYVGSDQAQSIHVPVLDFNRGKWEIGTNDRLMSEESAKIFETNLSTVLWYSAIYRK